MWHWMDDWHDWWTLIYSDEEKIQKVRCHVSLTDVCIDLLYLSSLLFFSLYDNPFFRFPLIFLFPSQDWLKRIFHCSIEFFLLPPLISIIITTSIQFNSIQPHFKMTSIPIHTHWTTNRRLQSPRRRNPQNNFCILIFCLFKKYAVQNLEKILIMATPT